MLESRRVIAQDKRVVQSGPYPDISSRKAGHYAPLMQSDRRLPGMKPGNGFFTESLWNVSRLHMWKRETKRTAARRYGGQIKVTILGVTDLRPKYDFKWAISNIASG